MKTLYLINDDYLSNCEELACPCRPATSDDLTAERVADYLDHQEEGDNFHHLVGAYDALRRLVANIATGEDEDARRLMLALLRAGGLRGLVRNGRKVKT